MGWGTTVAHDAIDTARVTQSWPLCELSDNMPAIARLECLHLKQARCSTRFRSAKTTRIHTDPRDLRKKIDLEHHQR